MARSKRASTVWRHRIWSVRRRNNQFTELHTQFALACTCTCTCTCTRSIINRDIIAKHKNQKLKSNLGCLISNEWDRDPQVLINNDACCAWFGWRLVNNTQKNMNIQMPAVKHKHKTILCTIVVVIVIVMPLLYVYDVFDDMESIFMLFIVSNCCGINCD